jgi:16S rRNA (cytidine1402-2'-O)-methyltransferase
LRLVARGGHQSIDAIILKMNSSAPGSLYLVPNTLDFGIQTELPSVQDALPMLVLQTAARLTHWVAENTKTTRAFLKRVDAVVPLAQALQTVSIIELPRPRKGALHAAPPDDLRALLTPIEQGFDLGLISEAGLPAVADPGAALVQAAHVARIRVVVLSGPSSLMLALAASGLNGQSFAFVGYLPVESVERAQRIRELEAGSRRTNQTQLMIETPYRNTALLGALLSHLQPTTQLSVSVGLTLPNAYTRCETVKAWNARPLTLPNDVPAVFALLA